MKDGRGAPLPARKVAAIERRLKAKERPASVAKALSVGVTSVYAVRRLLIAKGEL